MAERISTPSRTKQIIEENGFYFKKNFGQNFLIDSNILDNIAECAGVTKEDCVLEIGPGIGSLTQVLAEHAREVVAIEIDSNLIPILSKTLADYDKILMPLFGRKTTTAPSKWWQTCLITSPHPSSWICWKMSGKWIPLPLWYRKK